MPACEVVNPAGEVVLYPVADGCARRGEWRAWEVVSPDGRRYRVSEYPSGRWGCTCPWWVHRGRYRCEPDGRPADKHVRAVQERLAEVGHGGQDDRRSGKGLAGHG